MIVFCTVPDREQARAISRALVEEGLCACVNVLPQVTSFYVYEGKFCEEDELLLMIKTDKAHYAVLEQRIKTLHSYEVPEIIATSIEAGSKEYLQWLKKALTPL